MKLVASPYESVLEQAVGRPSVAQVLGSRTAYWEYGSASTVRSIVLVHGFRGDHHGLEAIAAHLAALDPELRVIVPDLPGFGISEPLREAGHDIDGYSRWLRDFSVAVGGSGSPILGHSFGTIVVSAALASGLDASKAVLVNPIAAPALSGPNAIGTRLAIFYYWLGSRLPEKLGFWVLRWRVVTRGMSVFMSKTKDPALRRWIHNQHDLYFGAFANRRVVLDAFRASVSHDVSEYASAITIPVRLIVAERDEITPLSAQRALVELFPDASMHVELGVGHLIHYERPAQAAAEIEAFISPGAAS